MIPGADKTLIQSLMNWVNAPEDDEGEREKRLTGIQKLLLADATDEEAAEIETMLRSLTRKPVNASPTSVLQSIMQKEKEEEQARPRRVYKRPSQIRLYDPRRTGYMRATREEGLGEELKKLRAESMGTPLYEDESQVPDTSRKTVQKLLQSMRGKKSV